MIRGEIISYSPHSNKQRKQTQQDLIDAIREIDRQSASFPTPELYAVRLKYQTEFDLLSTNRAEYLIIRTKGTYNEYDEKASPLLALHFRCQAASKYITQVYDSSHSLSTNPS